MIGTTAKAKIKKMASTIPIISELESIFAELSSFEPGTNRLLELIDSLV